MRNTIYLIENTFSDKDEAIMHMYFTKEAVQERVDYLKQKFGADYNIKKYVLVEDESDEWNDELEAPEEDVVEYDDEEDPNSIEIQYANDLKHNRAAIDNNGLLHISGRVTRWLANPDNLMIQVNGVNAWFRGMRYTQLLKESFLRQTKIYIWGKQISSGHFVTVRVDYTMNE